MTAEWCKACVKAAIAIHGEPEIINTDQGSQFTSPIFTNTFDGLKTELSMDGKGRWIDNVFIERFWHNIKYAMLCRLDGFNNYIAFSENVTI